MIALNMLDVAERKAVTLDAARLGRQLGVPVVPMQAHRKIGLDPLKQALADAVKTSAPAHPSPFPPAFQQEVAALEKTIQHKLPRPLPRYLVERLLLDTSGYLTHAAMPGVDGQISDHLRAARARLAEAGCPAPGVEAISRYQWVEQVLDGVIHRQATRKTTFSDRFDRLLTHKLWGTVSFIVLMLLVFTSNFNWSEWPMGLIETATGTAGQIVGQWLPEGALRSLASDGIVAGVGNVLVFLPQIFILFFFIAVLEDCGYMARAAYLMDRLMASVGLSGKSFIPLLSSFACAIPGIMAARVIENRRDRLVTILVAPLMSCSARLPVYFILTAAFIPPVKLLGGWLSLPSVVMLAMYMVGIVVAVVVAYILKKTILKGATPPFVMELPSYKIPSLRLVLFRVLDSGWAFVRRAGTLIFSVSVVVWAAGYFPHSAEKVEAPYQQRLAQLESELASAGFADPQQRRSLEEQQSQLKNQIAGAYMQQSLLGRMGRLIEPVVRPLGWDWRIGCAVIASFPAREVVIGTMGVIYNLGQVDDEHTRSLREKLKAATWDGSDRPVYNVPVALSIMVFFALCAQCASTLVIIRRETNSWRWPLFTFVYMTTLAYVGALATYQVGMFLSS